VAGAGFELDFQSPRIWNRPISSSLDFDSFDFDSDLESGFDSDLESDFDSDLLSDFDFGLALRLRSPLCLSSDLDSPWRARRALGVIRDVKSAAFELGARRSISIVPPARRTPRWFRPERPKTSEFFRTSSPHFEAAVTRNGHLLFLQESADRLLHHQVGTGRRMGIRVGNAIVFDFGRSVAIGLRNVRRHAGVLDRFPEGGIIFCPTERITAPPSSMVMGLRSAASPKVPFADDVGAL